MLISGVAIAHATSIKLTTIKLTHDPFKLIETNDILKFEVKSHIHVLFLIIKNAKNNVEIDL